MGHNPPEAQEGEASEAREIRGPSLLSEASEAREIRGPSLLSLGVAWQLGVSPGLVSGSRHAVGGFTWAPVGCSWRLFRGFTCVNGC